MTKPLVFEAWPLCIADRLTTEIAPALQASNVGWTLARSSRRAYAVELRRPTRWQTVGQSGP